MSHFYIFLTLNPLETPNFFNVYDIQEDSYKLRGLRDFSFGTAFICEIP